MIAELEFCKFRFFENYVICNIYEGVTVCQEKSDRQTAYLLNHFKNKPFVYITERIHSYSVDPSIYSKSSTIETLVGFAVVTSNYFAGNMASFEKKFINKPFEIFNDIGAAEDWAKNLLKDS